MQTNAIRLSSYKVADQPDSIPKPPTPILQMNFGDMGRFFTKKHFTRRYACNGKGVISSRWKAKPWTLCVDEANACKNSSILASASDNSYKLLI